MSRASDQKSRFPKFAAAVKRQMDELGISGRDLASQMGKREQTVSEWRRGTYRPEGPDLLQLANALHVSPEILRSDDSLAQRVGGVLRETALAPYGAEVDPVKRVVAQAQRDQVEFIRDFAARLLEASAAAIRQMPSASNAPNWVTSEDLAGDDAVIDSLEEAAAAARNAAQKKSATG